MIGVTVFGPVEDYYNFYSIHLNDIKGDITVDDDLGHLILDNLTKEDLQLLEAGINGILKERDLQNEIHIRYRSKDN